MINPEPLSDRQQRILQSGKEYPNILDGLSELIEYLDAKGDTETANGYDRVDEDKYIRLVDRMHYFIERSKD